MRENMRTLFEGLEAKKASLIAALNSCTDDQLRCQPAPDRWSMIMAVHHIILGEQGMRRSQAELRDHPLRRQLQPGKLFDVVLEVLEKDVPVEVPNPFLEPENTFSLPELIDLWNRERSQLERLLEAIPEDAVEQVMFSHPAAGPLDPVRALRLAHAHLDTHRRQVERLMAEIKAG